MKRGRPFEPGNKMGRGRPKGSGNKPKRPDEALLQQYAEPLMRTCVATALKGNTAAMRLCLERILPARQDAFVPVDLSTLSSADEIDQTAHAILRNVLRGRLTPLEAGRLMDALEKRMRIHDQSQFEERLRKLEDKIIPEVLAPI